MSRTIRRKDYENTQRTSWDRKGNRIAGYYTEYDFDPDWYWLAVYREPTDRERYRAVRWAHGESRARNERTPGWEYRHNRMRQNRSINKCEIAKWIKNDEYEPMTESNPRSCRWDWR